MFSFLELTDGTVATACELTDLLRYAAVSYAPGVAPQRDSLLGGAGVYDDVVDTITFHAIGATAAAAYANAGAVNKLLDQARAWWHGEIVSPVTIRATVQDSALGPLSAIVIGRAPGGPSPLALQAAWNENYGAYVIENITITFIRGDTWFGTAQTATSNTAAMPSVLTATFAAGAVDVQTASTVTLAGPLRRDVASLLKGYLIVAPQNRIEIVEGESTTNTGTGAAVVTADAANHASAGSVMRLTGPANIQLIKLFTAPFSANAYQLACFAVLRVNGPGVPVNPISARMQTLRGTTAVIGPWVDINYAYFFSNFVPQPVFLGVLDNRLPATSFLFQLQWTDAANTIDVDYFVFVALNNAPDARAVATVITQYTPFDGGGTNQLSVIYNPEALTQPAATVTGREAVTGSTEPWSVVGDPFLVSKQAVMTGMWLATHLSSWRPWDATAAAAIAFTLDWSRNVPYLIPQ